MGDNDGFGSGSIGCNKERKMIKSQVQKLQCRNNYKIIKVQDSLNALFSAFRPFILRTCFCILH